jgi:hypothetical protein
VPHRCPLGQRSPGRLTQRNRYRSREWDTGVGSIARAIPKLRQASYFPSFLEPHRRAEQAFVAVVQEAYVTGLHPQDVDRRRSESSQRRTSLSSDVARKKARPPKANAALELSSTHRALGRTMTVLLAVRGRGLVCDGSGRRSSPWSGPAALGSGAQVWPSVQGAPHSPQTCRRGQCFVVLCWTTG